MKKGYWVVAYRSVSDETALQDYAKIAVPAIEAQGGKVLIRTADIKPMEAGLIERTVVIEFDSLEQALATYHSDEYKVALKVLGAATERDFRIVEGV